MVGEHQQLHSGQPLRTGATAGEAQGSGPGKDPEPERRRHEALEVNLRDAGSELERNPTRNPQTTGTETQGEAAPNPQHPN